MKAVRPLMNRLGPVEAPPDSYFGNIQDLFQKIQGIDKVLEDPAITSVRLVTNAEKMVLRETQRAFVYFSLHGLTVDEVIVNRLLPVEIEDSFFVEWRESQTRILKEIEAYFAPVPVSKVPLFNREVLGYEGLRTVADGLYPAGTDPAAVRQLEKPYSFARKDGHYEVRLHMPFVEKGEIGLFKKRDELIVEVGTLRRHVGLPTTMAEMVPVKARMDKDVLVVEMRNAI
jgi:arsenite-transporting ATPase